MQLYRKIINLLKYGRFYRAPESKKDIPKAVTHPLSRGITRTYDAWKMGLILMPIHGMDSGVKINLTILLLLLIAAYWAGGGISDILDRLSMSTSKRDRQTDRLSGWIRTADTDKYTARPLGQIDKPGWYHVPEGAKSVRWDDARKPLSVQELKQKYKGVMLWETKTYNELVEIQSLYKKGKYKDRKESQKFLNLLKRWTDNKYWDTHREKIKKLTGLEAKELIDTSPSPIDVQT